MSREPTGRDSVSVSDHCSVCFLSIQTCLEKYRRIWIMDISVGLFVSKTIVWHGVKYSRSEYYLECNSRYFTLLSVHFGAIDTVTDSRGI